MRLFNSLALSLSLVTTLAHGAGLPTGSIKNLITFGDSYTDIVNTGDHGTAWPVYAADYGKFNLHSYAISGAACDERLTPRNNGHYIVQDELLSYFNDTKNGLKLDPKETLYTIWIGTNDVGDSTLLTGQQTRGVTIVQVTQCAVNWVKTLYDSGARNFVFQNVIFSPSKHKQVTSRTDIRRHTRCFHFSSSLFIAKMRTYLKLGPFPTIKRNGASS